MRMFRLLLLVAFVCFVDTRPASAMGEAGPVQSIPDQACPYPDGVYDALVEVKCLAAIDEAAIQRDGNVKRLLENWVTSAGCEVRYLGYDTRFRAPVVRRGADCAYTPGSLSLLRGHERGRYDLPPGASVRFIEGVAAALIRIDEDSWDIVPAPGRPGIELPETLSLISQAGDVGFSYLDWNDEGPRFLRVSTDPFEPPSEIQFHLDGEKRRWKATPSLTNRIEGHGLDALPRRPSVSRVPDVPCDYLWESEWSPVASDDEERRCMTAHGGVTKRGERYSVTLDNGKKAILRGNLKACRNGDADRCLSWTYLGTDQRLKAKIFYLWEWEAHAYLILDTKTGAKLYLSGEPHLSPDGSRLAFVQPGVGPVAQLAVQIFRREKQRWVLEFQDPPPLRKKGHTDWDAQITMHDFEAWETPERIRIRRSWEFSDAPTIAYLERRDGRWALVPQPLDLVINDPP
jgi:hypothetical protein